MLGQGRHARLLWGNRVKAFMPKGFGIIKKAPEAQGRVETMNSGPGD